MCNITCIEEQHRFLSHTHLAMAHQQVWTIELSPGVKMPFVGLGTYKVPQEEMDQIVNEALDLGYRHFDGADFYQNIEPLGQALVKAIAKGKVTREELFIATKIWPTFYGENRVIASTERQLAQSGLDYFDLILLHWPVVFTDSDHDWTPCDENGQIQLGTRSFVDVYKELELVQSRGLARSIGLSNFNAQQIKKILEVARIKPVVNQVECHAYLQQSDLHAFCTAHQIFLTAYRPLGAAGANPNAPNALHDETLVRIGKKYGKSPAQVVIRSMIERGIAVIPKSVNPVRMAQNIHVFDFELSEQDLAKIAKLDRGLRLVEFKLNGSHNSPDYPFNDPY